MKTFKQFREDEVQEAGFLGKIFKKKPAVAPAPAKPAFKSWKAKGDHSEYRTTHHYGGGDLDPETVPVFKPSWQTARGNK